MVIQLEFHHVYGQRYFDKFSLFLFGYASNASLSMCYHNKYYHERMHYTTQSKTFPFLALLYFALTILKDQVCMPNILKSYDDVRQIKRILTRCSFCFESCATVSSKVLLCELSSIFLSKSFLFLSVRGRFLFSSSFTRDF